MELNPAGNANWQPHHPDDQRPKTCVCRETRLNCYCQIDAMKSSCGQQLAVMIIIIPLAAIPAPTHQRWRITEHDQYSFTSKQAMPARRDSVKRKTRHAVIPRRSSFRKRIPRSRRCRGRCGATNYRRPLRNSTAAEMPRHVTGVRIPAAMTRCDRELIMTLGVGAYQ